MKKECFLLAGAMMVCSCLPQISARAGSLRPSPLPERGNPSVPGLLLFLGLLLTGLSLLGLSPPLVHAQDTTASGAAFYADSLTHLEDWGSYSVTAANQRIYFGSGNRLVVADVSDPTQPRRLGWETLPYLVRDVVVDGDHLYVANDAGGLRILQMVGPAELREVAAVSFDDRVDAVDLHDGYAYVAARSDGLHVLDVSDPDAPTKVGHHQTDDQAAGVTVEGDYAHVAATFGGHRILDVSDPSDPSEAGFAVRGSYDQGYSWDVAVQDTFAFVANVEIGLRRVNVADPEESAPTVDIQQTVHYTNDDRYRSEVLSRPAAVETARSYAYVADQNAGLRVVDLSDPDTLRIVGTADTPDRALDVSVYGDLAFVADRYAGIRVMDISDPFAPREIGFWDPDPKAVHVQLGNGHLYVGDQQNGLRTITTESPSPRSVGFHHRPGLRTFDLGASIAAIGDDSGRLQILDASNPTALSVVAEHDLPAAPEALHLSGSHAYVAAGTRGIRILDLSTPTRPREVGTYVPERDRADETQFRYYPNPPSAWKVTLSGSRLYASFDDGIHILDVSSPADPTLVGRFPASERAMETVVQNDYLFAAFDDGLRVIDVSNPTAPEQVGRLDTPSYARAVALRGNHLYLGDLTGGVLVVDVSDPTSPQRLSRLPLDRGRVVDLTADGRGRLFVAATSGGVQVLDVSDPSSPRLRRSD